MDSTGGTEPLSIERSIQTVMVAAGLGGLLMLTPHVVASIHNVPLSQLTEDPRRFQNLTYFSIAAAFLLLIVNLVPHNARVYRFMTKSDGRGKRVISRPGITVLYLIGLAALCVIATMIKITGGTPSSYFTIFYPGMVTATVITTEKTRHTIITIISCSIAAIWSYDGQIDGLAQSLSAPPYFWTYMICFTAMLIISGLADWWRNTQRKWAGFNPPENGAGQA